MRTLTDLVPPLDLCKMIPAGEFADSAFVWLEVEILDENQKEWRVINATKPILGCHNPKHPAPTFDEILDELHKCQEDVFVKWSETAYHGWLVNAYSHGRNEDYQAHDESKATAALKVWLKMKGIEYEQKQS